MLVDAGVFKIPPIASLETVIGKIKAEDTIVTIEIKQLDLEATPIQPDPIK